MAHKRRKRRTQPSVPSSSTGKGDTSTSSGVADKSIPKSMVIRMGATEVGPSISQLVRDVRSVMEPHTASRLKERRSNKLRDFTTIAGPLGVTHFLLFYKRKGSDAIVQDVGGANMKLAFAPRGPTFSFHVERYSLCKDVTKAQRRPKAGGAGNDHLTPPLLVMNNFVTAQQSDKSSTDHQAKPLPSVIPKHLEKLAQSAFQSIFPAINPQRYPLNSIRRVLLLSREDSVSEQSTESETSPSGSFTLTFRHYAITSKPVTPLSRGLKRLRTAEAHAVSRNRKPQGPDYPAVAANTSGSGSRSRKAARGGLPDMGRLDDVAEYVLDQGGYTSASESEVETDAEVEVIQQRERRVLSRQDRLQLQERREAAAAAAATVNATEDGIAAPQPSLKSTRPASSVQRRAVKLTELGPRMRLRMYKVEEGLCDGKVMWHESVKKTADEEKKLDELWKKRREEKEMRRREQKENIERKRRENRNNNVEEDEELEDLDEDMDEWLDEDDDGDLPADADEDDVSISGGDKS